MQHPISSKQPLHIPEQAAFGLFVGALGLLCGMAALLSAAMPWS